MEFLRNLKRGDLPPVGARILKPKLRGAHQLPNFINYSATWLDSGTSALALALLTAKKMSEGVTHPEVIVPAYCNPNIVAAAQFAGVKVVVVDISMNDPSYNLHSLKPALSSNTIAIVAVNFLGVREDLEKLHALKFKFPRLCVIEENSQWFPDENEFSTLSGDFVVFSFGKDMPVGLLSGGLLLSKHPISEKISPSPKVNSFFSAKQTLKHSAYNFSLRPYIYQLVNRNPFVSSEAMPHRPLEKICAMDGITRSLVMSNLSAYWESSQDLAKKYDEFFAHCKIHNKFGPMAGPRRKRLLRYPFLFGSLKKKDQILAQLKDAGLGATELYKNALTDIQALQGRITVFGEQKNAIFFAHHFITLPLHTGVSEQHLEMIKHIFSLEKSH